jgi:folate-dependent phosphoribosylglycinamide formyltransferase PurN
MRTALICHQGAVLDSEVLGRWLASFSDLAGIVILRESRTQLWHRIKREWMRSGPWHFLDVLSFRVYCKLFLSRNDRKWEAHQLELFSQRYPGIPRTTRFLHTASPNSAEAEQFLRELRPDVVLARCKSILKEKIFTIPRAGTLVMHPGVCPEYRNAHGCFWALANRDLNNVGMTLLKVDKGVDTGPVYGYYSYEYDEQNESHTVIQHRVVLENLDQLEKKFIEIAAGNATTIDTSGRKSHTWGQPWLSRYLAWKAAARKRTSEGTFDPIP